MPERIGSLTLLDLNTPLGLRLSDDFPEEMQEIEVIEDECV